MDFPQTLKSKAQQVIELSEQLAGRTHAWNQEESAPSGGYTDRAGFIIYDDIELFADIYVSEDSKEAKLRARLAWSPKDDKEQGSFTIITLDFESAVPETKELISKSANLTHQDIIGLLNNKKTKPALMHVSLEYSISTEGETSGKRYQYNSVELENLTEKEKEEFIKTLSEAYDFIVTKINR